MSTKNGSVRQQERTYECSLCDAAFPTESMARAHIAFSEDSTHNVHSGYMPEDTLNVVEDDEVVEQIDGTGSSYGSTISQDDLPDGLNRRDGILIMQAVDKAASINSIRELHERVKHALQAEGLTPLSYQSVLKKVDEYFKLDQEDTQEDVRIEDLPPEEQDVIEAYTTVDDLSPAAVADAADASKETVVQVLDNRKELIRESMSDTTTEPKKTETVEDTEQDTEQDTDTPSHPPSAEESPVLNRADPAPAQRKIIEYIARNPDATGEEVAEATGCSSSYPSRMRNEKSDVIRARAEELGEDVSAFDESNKRRTRSLTEQWSELTGQQKATLRLLSEKENPLDTQETFRDLADELAEKTEYETYASYIMDAQDKYGDFAVRLKEAKQVADSQEEAEQLVDSVPIDEALVVDGVLLHSAEQEEEAVEEEAVEEEAVEEEAVEEEAVEEEAVEEEAIEEEAVEEEAVEVEAVEEEAVEEEAVEEEAVEKEAIEEEAVEEEAIEQEAVKGETVRSSAVLEESASILSAVKRQKEMTEAELRQLDSSSEAASAARNKVFLQSIEEQLEDVIGMLEPTSSQ